MTITPGLPDYDVVIPAYRRAHVVLDAVRSVLDQSHPPKVVFVVDDASDDGTATIVRRVAEDDTRIHLFVHDGNKGASASRNTGADQGTSPWIAFLDSDDVWLPGTAAALLGAAVSGNLDVAVGMFRRVEGDGPPGPAECGWNGEDPIEEAIRTGGVVGPSWSILRREAFASVGGFDPRFRTCNDWDFFARLVDKGARFGRIDHPAALYRTVSGSRLMGETENQRLYGDLIRARFRDPIRHRSTFHGPDAARTGEATKSV